MSTYHTFILSSVKKHYIGYDKNKDAIDIIGMEGKKSDRAEFYHNVFKQVVNDVVKCNANPIHNLRYPDFGKSMMDILFYHSILCDKNTHSFLSCL